MTRKKRYEIHLTETAKIDLAEIWDYLSEESSESIATKLIERIGKRLQQAARFPLSGAPRFHMATGLRVLFHEKYAIYYLPGARQITVIRVLHGSRDLTAIADEGGFDL
jgi:toxin ParE1/3/4